MLLPPKDERCLTLEDGDADAQLGAESGATRDVVTDDNIGTEPCRPATPLINHRGDNMALI